MTTITTQSIRSLMRGYIDSLALNTALEVGLFWLLDEAPRTAEQVGAALGVPAYRCGPWLELLAGLGLLERRGEQYAPSAEGRAAILDAFRRETWSHLAEEERLRYAFGVDLSRHMSHPLSVWAGQNRMPHNYLAAIAADAGFARRFTHMLYELHLPLAEQVAAALELSGGGRLMDLGGGSGVIALALLRRDPALSAVVVDHPHVCAAGREIAATRPEGERLRHEPGDFLRDDLPAGCDLALLCDVGIYSQALFRKVWCALNPGGRLIIVDEFESPRRAFSHARRRYAFYEAMTGPRPFDRGPADAAPPSVGRVQALLARAGFQLSVEQRLEDGTFILQGRK